MDNTSTEEIYEEEAVKVIFTENIYAQKQIRLKIYREAKL